ncbi:MAG: outer membrane lipoprotein carrier protein LolA [Desulfuromonas sp.]|nr:MAG: outer membrane lipoprotein carrier protein LolA [Desulfuromonas sp.]
MKSGSPLARSRSGSTRTMKQGLLISFFLLLLVLPVGASELKTLLDRMQQTAASTQTLSSTFVQEKHLAIFSEKLISQGRFAYARPDRLRWELLTPFESGFVLNGRNGQRWNGLSREMGDFSVDRDPAMGMIAQQLLAWARVDLDWLSQRYRMELLSNRPVQLRLIPLDQGEAGFIRHLEMTFADDLRSIVTVLLQEAGGDKTLLRFSQVELNAQLPEEMFRAPEF